MAARTVPPEQHRAVVVGAGLGDFDPLRPARAQERGLESAREVGTLPEAEQQQLLTAVLRRELGVMALSAAVVVFLALRAAGTAHGF